MSTESCLRNVNIRLLVCCALLWSTLFSSITTCAFAEQRNIRGISFSVTELRPTGAGYTAVVLGGESRLVEDARIDAFIVEQYFKNRDLFLTLSTKQVEDFVSQAVQDGDIDSASLALQGLFEFGDATSAPVVAFIEKLQEWPQTIELFKRVLPNISTSTVSPRIVSVIVTAIGMRDLHWIREHTPRILYTNTEELRNYLRSRVYEYIRDQRVSEAEPLATLMKEIFSADDPEVKSLQLLLVKLQSLLSGDLQNQHAIPLSLSELSGNDPVLLRYLAPIYVDTLNQRALAALKDNEAEKALTLVSMIDLERRTPATHSLLIEALQALPAGSELLLQNQKIQDYAVFISQKDSFVREAYIESIELIIGDRIGKGLLIEARVAFEALSRVRPDPNSLNDAVRIKGAKRLIEDGRGEKANQLLGDVRTGVPIFSRFSIFTAKLFNAPLILGFVLLGFVGVIWVLWYILNRAERPQQIAVQYEVEDDEEEQRPAFVTARGGGKGGGLPQEYLECLHEFGLTQSSSMKDIKTAFRNRVKDIHPDNQQVSGEDPAEFIRIKAVYERLLEIRKRMGLE